MGHGVFRGQVNTLGSFPFAQNVPEHCTVTEWTVLPWGHKHCTVTACTGLPCAPQDNIANPVLPQGGLGHQQYIDGK